MKLLKDKIGLNFKGIFEDPFLSKSLKRLDLKKKHSKM